MLRLLGDQSQHIGQAILRHHMHYHKGILSSKRLIKSQGLVGPSGSRAYIIGISLHLKGVTSFSIFGKGEDDHIHTSSQPFCRLSYLPLKQITL